VPTALSHPYCSITVTVQVVKTGITPPLATSNRLRVAEMGVPTVLEQKTTIVDIRLTHSKKPVAEHRGIRAPGVIEQVAPSAYDAGADAIGRRTRRKPGWRHRDIAAALSVW
jgi:hypothetical protein